MAESGLDSLRETHPINIQWKAYELRPEGTPPIPPEYRARIEQGWPRVQQMARERFNVEMKHPGLKDPGATFLAHVGGKFAEQHGLGEAYHKTVFKAHWQTDQDIADPDTLTHLAGQVGLDETAFREALTDETLHAAVRADEYWAMQNGLNGVPAFIFGNKYLVSGAQPVEVLRRVADRCIDEGLIND